ncbi:hypothetical protein GCK72_008272 [Caenorhabditis remanei]|uniref:Uncharacterized protein n=1 Tax=Caenorhabditis remanei TaxID=31234 RepID=A0A6A5GZT4_CAERE|nr:hypothetical protein GCK72_008272 [Caenorhabditis remanei]KAF1760026.1 hypothetical protein GCK72_008272 [Caenorhabditis remanei]
MAIFLIVSCFLLVPDVSCLTKFQFSGRFWCSLPFFRHNITIYEDDWVYDTAISHMGAKNSTKHMKNFELYMDIRHSCNSKGERVLPYKMLRVHLGNFPQNNAGYYKLLYINLTDAGLAVPSLIGGY